MLGSQYIQRSPRAPRESPVVNTSDMSASSSTSSTSCNERNSTQICTFTSSSDENRSRKRKSCKAASNSSTLESLKFANEGKCCRRLYSKKCRDLVDLDKVNVESILDLIKRYLLYTEHMLSEPEYYIFMDHTMSVLMEKTGESEDILLCLQCKDFEEAQEITTKRGNIVHIMDTTSEKCLILQAEEWDCLKLYVTSARNGILRRVNGNGSNVSDTNCVFIKYDGQPLMEKVEENEYFVTEPEEENELEQAEGLSEETFVTESEEENKLEQTEGLSEETPEIPSEKLQT